MPINLVVFQYSIVFIVSSDVFCSSPLFFSDFYFSLFTDGLNCSCTSEECIPFGKVKESESCSISESRCRRRFDQISIICGSAGGRSMSRCEEDDELVAVIGYARHMGTCFMLLLFWFVDSYSCIALYSFIFVEFIL